ncbi:MAG: hypothetical protein JWP20_437 [Roseomonas sp.]|nr:hypothetical protein [Roseomonas sp.]
MLLKTKMAFATLLSCAVLAPAQASAQTYPDRPVRMVVPFAPGGGSDIAARFAAQCMASHLGQTVTVETGPARAAPSAPRPWRRPPRTATILPC